MILVAKLYGLPPRVLPSIQSVEGGRPGSMSPNADGSFDLGVMQVNTRWIPALARYTGQPPAVVEDRLTHVACYNIAAAGVILRTYLNEAHDDLALAIGNYHSHTAPLHVRYRRLVMQAAARLFGSAGRRER